MFVNVHYILLVISARGLPSRGFGTALRFAPALFETRSFTTVGFLTKYETIPRREGDVSFIALIYV
eukprot:Awhi_evm2s12438